jgi:hypothetical protein
VELPEAERPALVDQRGPVAVAERHADQSAADRASAVYRRQRSERVVGADRSEHARPPERRGGVKGHRGAVEQPPEVDHGRCPTYR